MTWHVGAKTPQPRPQFSGKRTWTAAEVLTAAVLLLRYKVQVNEVRVLVVVAPTPNQITLRGWRVGDGVT